MKAATLRVCITPSGTFYMDGYASDERRLPALGVHDDAYSVLVLLEHGGVRTLFVSIDACNISLSRTARMRSLLCEVLDLEDERLVISTIHSHSCPTGLREGTITGKESYGWPEMVCGLVVQAATGLVDRLVEVRAELMETRVRGWYSTRNSKDKPFDDEAFVVRFVGEDGSTVAGMLNFNCHATVVGPKNRYLTTDVQGGVRAHIADWLGVTPYAFTGASGDLGNRQFRQGNDFAELARVSCGIAGELMKGSFEPIELSAPSVRVFRKDIDYDNTVHFDRYRQQIAEAQAVLDDSSASFDAKKLARTEVMRLGERLELDRIAFPMEMRIYDFSQLVIVTFPGELGSVLGMRIKSMFPGKRVFVIGYANDGQGYFVPAGDFGLGYESFVTKLPAGGIESVLDEFEDQL